MYGSVGSDLTQTQPFYSYAHYHDYRRPPGFLNAGYFTAQARPSHTPYSQRHSLNPAYYYAGSGRAYFGPWYKPAPLASAPSYHLSHPSSYSRSYARRSGDMAMSASSLVPSFAIAPAGG